ncbi:arsenate reductase [Byssothecium circinans]|uniref:Arsenate reductase n=1 Tax=Byssothecium circinans TaxID=147558 RepID=A0A6A5TYK2_9PLEO|nr:arsenate reductase [Byssothecium circinans]
MAPLSTRRYNVYPEPSTKTPPTISRQELLAWVTQEKIPGRDFVVIDLRGSDHTDEGGFLRGSVNLPIESLHPALPTLHTLFRNAGIKTVVWYCTTSRGRGNRAAAWFGDFLKQRNDLDIQSLALFEGILGWVTAGSEYTQHLDEYVPDAWDPADDVNHTEH